MKKLVVSVWWSMLLSASVSLSQPSWVKSKSSPTYPDRLYIVGVGFANRTKDRAADMQKAYDAAFADIAKQIKSTVASQSSLHEYEVLSDTMNALEQKASAEIKVSTEVKLGGLRIVDTYYDDDNEMEWALAVLNRISAGNDLKETEGGYLADYRKAMEGARTYASSGNVCQAMLTLVEALKSQVRYNLLLPIYNFVTNPLAASDSTFALPGTILMSETRAAAQSILSSMRIEKTGGDTQSVSLKSGVSPLALTVTCPNANRSLPVQGIKINYAFRNGSGSLSGSSTTDASGNSSCDILSLLPSRNNLYTIAASIDLSEFKIAGDEGATAEFQDWNNFIDRNQSVTTFTLKRSRASLEDRLADVILGLTSKISDSTASVAVSRIVFEEKLPGPMAAFLRQKIEAVIQSATNLTVISQDAIRNSQIQLSDAGSLDNLSLPEYASQAAGAKYSIIGNYWKEGDNLNLSLKIVDVNTRVLSGSASEDIPLEWLPKISLAPENYNPVSDDNIIRNEKKGEQLKIDVWIDRVDGVYHEGDTISIYIRANDDCYAQLVYNDAGGNSLLVFPNKVSWNSQIKGGVTYRVPGTFVMQAPFGREILKAYASNTRVPVAQGKEIGNLVVLDSGSDFQNATRTAGLKGEGYAESSVVITTLARNNGSLER